MYNLLVKGNGWGATRDSMSFDRIFEYTEPELINKFKIDQTIDFNALISLPCLFIQETFGDRNRVVQVGNIVRATKSRLEANLEYFFDTSIPPLTNGLIERLASDLDIQDFEFSRKHWAVKNIDLFQVLLRNLQPRRQLPRVFSILDPENIEPTLASVMMPFHPSFDAVYSELKKTTESIGFHCKRADDIWKNPAVIQDVVSLIDSSKILICDCTGRNPNVFYEIGIAHALGRETILITQSESDIPFDLRHLRYVKYLNNGEGLAALSSKLSHRLNDII